MDPATQNILQGIIANGLYSLIEHIGRQSLRRQRHDKSPPKELEQAATISSTLQKATISLAKSLHPNQKATEKFRCFLASPTVEAIVRQIYACRLNPTSKNTDHLDSARQEFVASLNAYLGRPQGEPSEDGKDLFNALVGACDETLKTAVDKGMLSAHEARSARRHNLILDELAGIRKNLDFLTAHHVINIDAVLEFEEKYRDQVAHRHKYIVPPHFDVARKLPMEDVDFQNKWTDIFSLIGTE